MEARHLYLGDHWSVIRSLPQVAAAQGWRPQLWVASAGYGLVIDNALLLPYSATFSFGHRDSVTDFRRGPEARAANAAWWTELARQRLPSSNAPRSVQALAADNRSAVILVVASPDYVAAMQQDLEQAAAVLRSRSQLIVVSSTGRAQVNGLAPHWVSSDARLQARLGGSRISLNARLAQQMLQESARYELRADVLQQRYARLIERAPDVVQFDREAMTDAQVRDFVRKALRQSPDVSHSRLLRQLRDSGFRCEQARFKMLFREVRDASHGA